MIFANLLAPVLANVIPVSSSEFAVADLMSAFLFPEVEREAMRDRGERCVCVVSYHRFSSVSRFSTVVRCDQRRFLLAAHQAVHGALSDVTRGVESGSKKN